MPKFTYQDLLESPFSLSEIAKKCGLSHIRKWQSRGIPDKYQPLLASLFSSAKNGTGKTAKNTLKNNSLHSKSAAKKSNKNKELQNNFVFLENTGLSSSKKSLKNKDLLSGSSDTQKNLDIFDFSLQNNDLDSKNPSLVIYTKFQAVLISLLSPFRIYTKSQLSALHRRQSLARLKIRNPPSKPLIDDSVDIYGRKIRALKPAEKVRFVKKSRLSRQAVRRAADLDIDNLHAAFLPPAPVHSEPLRVAFSKIRPYEPPKITIEGKTLVQLDFDRCDDSRRQYIDENGEVFEFVRRFARVKDESGKFKNVQLWQYVPPRDVLLAERFRLKFIAGDFLPEERVCTCFRKRISLHVAVRKSIEHNACFFTGTQICGGLWFCPVCAAKISERRRLEVQSAFVQHKAAGGLISFCTRTVPHSDTDSLESILLGFRQAEATLKDHRRYKNLMQHFGVIGSIKIYEITVGSNGWHLHVHQIYFHDPASAFPDVFERLEKPVLSKNNAVLIEFSGSYLKAFEKSLYPLWRRSAVNAGFSTPSVKHGLQVQDGDFANEYITKWGKEPESFLWSADYELTRSHIKSSKKGLTPFDMLRMYRDTGDLFYRDLFQEYARCIKGEQQLRWSAGLKRRFSISQKTDEEVATEQDELAFLLGLLDADDWTFIDAHRCQSLILSLGNSGGFDAIRNFLDSQKNNSSC